MREYSNGILRKRQRRDGSWVWCGVVFYYEDGKQHQITKVLGIPCDPMTEDEKPSRGRGKSIVPNGTGAVKAVTALRQWRDSLVESESARSREEQQGTEEGEEPGAKNPEGNMTVSEYVQRYIDDLERRNEKAKSSSADRYTHSGRQGKGKGRKTSAPTDATVLTNKYVAKHIIGQASLNVRMCELTSEHVTNWIHDMESEGLSSSMINKAFKMLRAICNHAIETGNPRFMEVNPCRGAEQELPDAPTHVSHPLNFDGVKKLTSALDNIDATDSSRWWFTASVRIAVLTGMREGEICGLRWKSVEGWESGNFEGRTLHVSNVIARSKDGGLMNKPPKTSKSDRRLPISAPLAKELRRCWDIMHEECDMMGHPFTGELYVTGKAVPADKPNTGFRSGMYLSHAWKMFVGVAGITGDEGGVPTFHDLRHTYATLLINRGLGDETIANLMGHASTEVTRDIYVSSLREADFRAMEVMAGIFEGASENG